MICLKCNQEMICIIKDKLFSCRDCNSTINKKEVI